MRQSRHRSEQTRYLVCREALNFTLSQCGYDGPLWRYINDYRFGIPEIESE
jgi:hypothetical protein